MAYQFPSITLDLLDTATTPETLSDKGRIYIKTGSPDSLFYKSKNGTETELTAGAAGSPGGSDTYVQYNNSGSFGGDSKFVFSGGTSPTFVGIGSGLNSTQLRISARQPSTPSLVPNSDLDTGFNVNSSNGNVELVHSGTAELVVNVDGVGMGTTPAAGWDFNATSGRVIGGNMQVRGAGGITNAMAFYSTSAGNAMYWARNASTNHLDAFDQSGNVILSLDTTGQIAFFNGLTAGQTASTGRTMQTSGGMFFFNSTASVSDANWAGIRASGGEMQGSYSGDAWATFVRASTTPTNNTILKYAAGYVSDSNITDNDSVITMGISTNLATGATLSVNSTQVVTTRQTGWGAPTGTATRTTFDTTTVTTEQLAERVHALIDDLTTHGLIGA